MTSTWAMSWNQQEPLQTALDALEHFQWSVFPLDEEKRPPKIGQSYPDGTPQRLAWKHWQTRRPSAKEVRFWQEKYQPCAWTVITGTISGLVLLDFDGEAGRETCQRLGLDPHVRTGSGGYHCYFQHPGWHVPTLNSKSKRALGQLWPGLDIRADGGYAAFCGRNAHGPYIWLRDPVLLDLSLLPDDLRQILALLPQSESDRKTHFPLAGLNLKQEALLQLPTSRLDRIKQLLMTALEQAQTGGRNNAGFWLACQLRDHKYTWKLAQAALLEFVARVASVNSKGLPEPYTEGEALASLTSAYRQAGNHTASATETANAQKDQPSIFLGQDPLRETVDQAIAAIQQHEQHSPRHFMQTARMINIGQDELKSPIIHQMSLIHVREVLTHAADFYYCKSSVGKDKTVTYANAKPPRDVCEQILARQTEAPYLPFPELVGLTEVPIIRPDGSICDQPGYDAATRLFYAPPSGYEPCQVPSQPTRQDVVSALELIWSGFGEFSYASEADRANALALLITPVLRPIIQRHILQAMVTAPKAGAGKGLLVDAISVVATGRTAAILTPSSNEEEWEKRITAMLMAGQNIICIDNVVNILQSSTLEALLTSDIFHGRVLGQSTMVKVPNRTVCIATGNNLKIGGDLARRCFWIRLDPKMSRPWMRTGFRHPDLIDWLVKQRMQFIRAILILFRAWHVAGRPLAQNIPALGTFSHWARTVGSILAYAGVTGFLDNLMQSYDETDEAAIQWETFLQAWHEAFGSNWIKIADVVQRMTQQTDSNTLLQDLPEIDLMEALPERLQVVFKEKPNSFKIRLGQELRKHANEHFGANNIYLEQGAKDRTGTTCWRVNFEHAGDVSANSHAKSHLSSHKSAGSAGSAGGISVSSHGNIENSSHYGVSQPIYGDEGNNSQHSQHSQQRDVPQTSLESDPKPNANDENHPSEFPASSAKLTDAVASPTSNGQSETQIAANNDFTVHSRVEDPVAAYYAITPVGEDWEEVGL